MRPCWTAPDRSDTLYTQRPSLAHYSACIDLLRSNSPLPPRRQKSALAVGNWTKCQELESRHAYLFARVALDLFSWQYQLSLETRNFEGLNIVKRVLCLLAFLVAGKPINKGVPKYQHSFRKQAYGIVRSPTVRWRARSQIVNPST